MTGPGSPETVGAVAAADAADALTEKKNPSGSSPVAVAVASWAPTLTCVSDCVAGCSLIAGADASPAGTLMLVAAVCATAEAAPSPAFGSGFALTVGAVAVAVATPAVTTGENGAGW